jgi:hypothetical protein
MQQAKVLLLGSLGTNLGTPHLRKPTPIIFCPLEAIQPGIA